MKAKLNFNVKIFFRKTKKLYKMSFSSSTNIQFTIWACKSVEIDAIGIEVAQKMKLSGCPTKGHSSVKSGKNAFLSVKRPFIGQPDNFIC